MSICEDDRVFAVDIEPYFGSNADGTPYPLGSTVSMFVDGRQFDYWPSIGPYERTEKQALRFIEGMPG